MHRRDMQKGRFIVWVFENYVGFRAKYNFRNTSNGKYEGADSSADPKYVFYPRLGYKMGFIVVGGERKIEFRALTKYYGGFFTYRTV